VALRKSKFWQENVRGLLALGLFLFSSFVSAAVNLGEIHSYYSTSAAASAACEAEKTTHTAVSIISGCIIGYPAGTAPDQSWTLCYVQDGTSTGDWRCARFIIKPTCPAGETVNVNDGCVPETTDGTCEIGTEKTFSNNQSSDPTDLAATICGTDGCLYTLQPHMAYGLPSLGSSSGQYIATSTQCEAGIDAPTEEQVLPGKQCAEDAYGNKICIEPAVSNCGEFNGVQFCSEDIPTTGTCTLLGSGGFICDGTAEPPLNTDGTAQHEVADVTDGTNDAKIYDAAGGKDAQGIAEGNEDAVIDETGTPTGSDDMFGGALDGTGIDGYIDGLGGEGEGGGVTGGGGSIALDLGLPQSATCTSISFSFQGTPVVFPGTDGCDKLDKWKDIIGWFLYCATAIYLVRVATRKPA